MKAQKQNNSEAHSGNNNQAFIQRACNQCSAENERPFIQRACGAEQLSSEPQFISQAGASSSDSLAIGAADGESEREADKMAERVINQTAYFDLGHSGANSFEAAPYLQRLCNECEQEFMGEEVLLESPHQLIQREAEDDAGQVSAATLTTQLHSRSGRGEELPDHIRLQMEQAFGRDFSQVRIHRDAEAIAMSRAVNARAFTFGSDIYFNQNQFTPDTREGKRLLAHELTHVVQQNSNSSSARLIQRDGPPRAGEQAFRVNVPDDLDRFIVWEANNSGSELDPTLCLNDCAPGNGARLFTLANDEEGSQSARFFMNIFVDRGPLVGARTSDDDDGVYRLKYGSSREIERLYQTAAGNFVWRSSSLRYSGAIGYSVRYHVLFSPQSSAAQGGAPRTRALARVPGWARRQWQEARALLETRRAAASAAGNQEELQGLPTRLVIMVGPVISVRVERTRLRPLLVQDSEEDGAALLERAIEQVRQWREQNRQPPPPEDAITEEQDDDAEPVEGVHGLQEGGDPDGVPLPEPVLRAELVAPEAHIEGLQLQPAGGFGDYSVHLRARDTLEQLSIQFSEVEYRWELWDISSAPGVQGLEDEHGLNNLASATELQDLEAQVHEGEMSADVELDRRVDRSEGLERLQRAHEELQQRPEQIEADQQEAIAEGRYLDALAEEINSGLVGLEGAARYSSELLGIAADNFHDGNERQIAWHHEGIFVVRCVATVNPNPEPGTETYPPAIATKVIVVSELQQISQESLDAPSDEAGLLEIQLAGLRRLEEGHPDRARIPELEQRLRTLEILETGSTLDIIRRNLQLKLDELLRAIDSSVTLQHGLPDSRVRAKQSSFEDLVEQYRLAEERAGLSHSSTLLTLQEKIDELISTMRSSDDLLRNGTDTQVENLRQQVDSLAARLGLGLSQEPVRPAGEPSVQRVQGSLVSRVTGRTYPLLLQISEPTLVDGRWSCTLSDVTDHHGSIYSGSTPAAADREAAKYRAVIEALEDFAGAAGYGEGSLSVRLPEQGWFASLSEEQREQTLVSRPRDWAAARARLEELGTAIALLGLVVSSPVLGAVGAGLGAALAVQRIAQRVADGTFTWTDPQNVGDMLDILSAAAVGLGATVRTIGPMRVVPDGLGGFTLELTQGARRLADAAETVETALDVVGVLHCNAEAVAGLASLEGQTGAQARRERARILAGVIQSNAMFGQQLGEVQGGHREAPRRRSTRPSADPSHPDRSGQSEPAVRSRAQRDETFEPGPASVTQPSRAQPSAESATDSHAERSVPSSAAQEDIADSDSDGTRILSPEILRELIEWRQEQDAQSTNEPETSPHPRTDGAEASTTDDTAEPHSPVAGEEGESSSLSAAEHSADTEIDADPIGLVHYELDASEAADSLAESIRRDRDREVGMWQDMITGRFLVVQGTADGELVGPDGLPTGPHVPIEWQDDPTLGSRFRLVEHYHPGDDFRVRFASPEDFAHILHAQITGQEAPGDISSRIRWRDTEGNEHITEFGYVADIEAYWIMYRDAEGELQIEFFDDPPWHEGSDYQGFLEQQGIPVSDGVEPGSAPAAPGSSGGEAPTTPRIDPEIDAAVERGIRESDHGDSEFAETIEDDRSVEQRLEDSLNAMLRELLYQRGFISASPADRQLERIPTVERMLAWARAQGLATETRSDRIGAISAFIRAHPELFSGNRPLDLDAAREAYVDPQVRTQVGSAQNAPDDPSIAGIPGPDTPPVQQAPGSVPLETQTVGDIVTPSGEIVASARGAYLASGRGFRSDPLQPHHTQLLPDGALEAAHQRVEEARRELELIQELQELAETLSEWDDLEEIRHAQQEYLERMEEYAEAMEAFDSQSRGEGSAVGPFDPTDHAERQLIASLERQLARLGRNRPEELTLRVVLTQLPCGIHSQNCMGMLRSFARRHGLRLEVYVPRDPNRTTGPQGVSARWTRYGIESEGEGRGDIIVEHNFTYDPNEEN